MADGALRQDVIDALRGGGCAVDAMSDGHVRISKESVIQVHKFHDVVSRTKCAALGRVFGVPMPAFFPPLKPPPQP
jgi:hypothetical protein